MSLTKASYSLISGASVNAADFGFVGDNNTDNATAVQLLTDYVNAIPNPDGQPVTVVFPRGYFKCSTTMHFTRPVSLKGNREFYLHYTGSGNAIRLGPNGLTGLTDTQKYYSVQEMSFEGGTTSGNAIYVSEWITYPSIDKCRFIAFGGNGSWAVFCQYNNWSVYVRDCEFWGSTNNIADTAKRNFVKGPGVSTDGTTLDFWATRINAIDNWVYSGGFNAGGIAYWFTGWKSRIQGGGVEGPSVGVVIGAGCQDVELNGVYFESLFSDPSIPRVIQLSAATGDAYWPTYTTVGRIKLMNVYANMHNTDSLASNGRFLVFHQSVKLVDINIDGLTLVHNGQPVIEFPEIDGHRGINYSNVKLDGNIAANTFLFETKNANLYKPGYDLVAHNYNETPDFSAIVTGITSTAAPLSSNFGTTTLSVESDGTGGSYTMTKIAAVNTLIDPEFYRIGQQQFYGQFTCNSAPTGQTYVQIAFNIDANLTELQNENIVLSFWGRAFNNPVTVSASHVYVNAGLPTSGQNTQTIDVGSWKRYAIQFKLGSIPLGTSIVANESQRVLLFLPINIQFSVALAGVVLSKGDIAIPLSSCR
jgi:hypothetical protein